MEVIGLVLFMLATVVLSGVLVRTLPLAVPTPLLQIGWRGDCRAVAVRNGA
jgi:hypothetical protein